MKITEIKAVYPNYTTPLNEWRPHLWQIVVEVRTDAGVTGWGSGGGGKASLPIINGHFRELVVGVDIESVEDIEKLWDTLYAASVPYGRKGIAMMALSGLDNALWDLLGRAEGCPVYELTGGLQRDAVAAYATGTDWRGFADLGYTSIKLNYRREHGGIDDFVGMFADAREALGNEVKLMTDCYMTWNESDTMEVWRGIKAHKPYFLEDVCLPDEHESHRRIKGAIKPALLAGGEHEFTHYGFLELAEAGTLDIWQPDITWCGGFTAGRRIVDIAAAHAVNVIPHRGGEAWGLHLILSSGCGDLAEINPFARETGASAVWENEPVVEKGVLQPPEGHGFGVVPADR